MLIAPPLQIHPFSSPKFTMHANVVQNMSLKQIMKAECTDRGKGCLFSDS